MFLLTQGFHRMECEARGQLRRRNLLTVAFGRNGTIVPYREFFVEADFHGFEIIIWVAFLEWVVARQDLNGRSQSLSGAGSCHGLAGDFDGGQQQALAGARHVRKETVFDGVVLRAI